MKPTQSGRSHKQSHWKFFCNNRPGYSKQHHSLHRSSQYGAGRGHWLHLGRLGAVRRSNYRLASLLQQLGFLLWVVFLNFRGGSERSREQICSKSGCITFRSACSTSENTPVGSAATIPEGGSAEWQEALLRRSSPPPHCDPCQSSSRSSHTPPQTQSVYFPISALCICKYAP